MLFGVQCCYDGLYGVLLFVHLSMWKVYASNHVSICGVVGE